MTTIPYTVVIDSWERIYHARRNWPCANCGGKIHRRSEYLQRIKRDGAKYKGPLEPLRYHLDCERPWYQASDEKRCSGLARLPGRVPPIDARDPRLVALPISFVIQSPSIGSITWTPPEELTLRFAHAREIGAIEIACGDIYRAFGLFAEALIKAAGNRRESERLGHLLEDLHLYVGREIVIEQKSAA